MTALELGVDAILAFAIIFYLSGLCRDAKRKRRANRLAQKTVEAVNGSRI